MSIYCKIFLVFYLAEEEIHTEHQRKSCKERIGCTAFCTVGVGLGNHLIGDNVKHCSACKSKGKRQNKSRHTNGKVADQRADNLNKTC